MLLLLLLPLLLELLHMLLLLLLMLLPLLLKLLFMQQGCGGCCSPQGLVVDSCAPVCLGHETTCF